MRLAPVVVLAVAGCTSLTVREPICDPPDIPAELLQPCEEPMPLTDGRFATVYQQMLADLGPWGRCVRKDDKLIEVVKYRDAVCQRVKDKIKADAEKPWYKFW
jgi:hypothetical protein